MFPRSSPYPLCLLKNEHIRRSRSASCYDQCRHLRRECHAQALPMARCSRAGKPPKRTRGCASRKETDFSDTFRGHGIYTAIPPRSCICAGHLVSADTCMQARRPRHFHDRIMRCGVSTGPVQTSCRRVHSWPGVHSCDL